MKIVNLCLFSVILIVSTACGGGDSNPITTNPTDNAASKPAINIIGEWRIGCINKKIEVYNFRITTSMTGFILDEYARVNGDCSQGTTNYSTAVYSIGKAFTTEDGVRVAYELDIKWAADPTFEWYGGDVKQLVYRKGDLLYFGVVKSDKSRPTQIDDSKRFALYVKPTQ